MNWFKCAISSKPSNVKLKGILKKNGDYYYLSVDDNFSSFYSVLENDDIVNPEDIQDEDKKVGSHISVIRSEEGEGLDIEELGEEFSFHIKGFERVEPDGWEEVKEVFFLTVESKELEDLRKKYDLSPKIKDHEFHITVGVIPSELV